MELSVREVAALLGRRSRTVRAQVARGELPGMKVRGRWLIRRNDLPLTEAQRQLLQEKANRVRSSLEQALPSRLAANSDRRRRSLEDLDAFRLGRDLLLEIRGHPEILDARSLRQLLSLLHAALLSLSEGLEQFDRRVKLEALNHCRSCLARALAMLLIEGGGSLRDPLFEWVAILEGKILPSVAGLARWADGLGRKN